MLKKLSQEQYPAAFPLFSALRHELVIRSAVEGHTPAEIYADRPAAPRLALFWDRYFAMAVGGEVQDMMALAALRNLLHNHLLPDMRRRGVPLFSFAAAPAWMAQAPALLHGLDAAPARRSNFLFEPGAPLPSESALPALPEGFTLQPLTAELIGRPQAVEVRGWVRSFWHSVEDFLRVGFGWAAVESASGDIAAWCLTVFASTQGAVQEREMGVETAQPYRGRGLGTLVAAACARQAQQAGVRLHWHCWADNQPSAAIAGRLGFTHGNDTTVFRCSTGAA